MTSAGEDLCLLGCEFLLSQYPGCLELTKLLKLANYVGLRRRSRRGRVLLRRRWRRLLRVRLLLVVRLRLCRLLVLGRLLIVLLRPPVGLSA
jgi:hypothetical protein